MIDREKVIANLTRCQHGLCDECDLEHASHYVWDCEVQDQLINDALELLKGQEPQTVNGWVSVKDRLPDEDGSTLICTKNGKVCTARFYKRQGGWNAYAGKNAEYWMPLPEPPKDVSVDG